MGKPQTIRETKAVPKALMDISAVKSRLARKRESVMAGLRKLNCPKVGLKAYAVFKSRLISF